MRLNALLTEARQQITRYGLAAALVIVCAGVRLCFQEYCGSRFATVFFYPAVVAVAYFLGFGPSLLASAFSAAASRYVLMLPFGQYFDFSDPWDPSRLGFFMLTSSSLAYVICQLQDSKKRISLLASEAVQSRNHIHLEQELLRRLLAQQEAEKQVLCNDFHDGLIQHVVGSKLLLEATLNDSPENKTLHEVVHHLTKGIDDGRRVIRGVRPSVLDEPGLAGPLHELVEHFSAVGLNVDVADFHDVNDSDVPEVIRTAFFRICQEALTNSWKHSGCTKATVRVEKQGHWLNLEIDDDGRGIDGYQHAATNGFGLKGMDARARLLGGSLEITGKQKGTRVRARLPLLDEHTAHPAVCWEAHERRANITSVSTLRTKDQRDITRYALAMAVVGVSLLIRLTLNEYYQGRFFVTVFFYPGVIGVAYFLGFGPSLLASALSGVAIRYFFLRPYGQLLSPLVGRDVYRLPFFLIASSSLAYLICQLQASKKRASLMASEAIRSRDELRLEQDLLRRLIAQQEAERQVLCNDFHDGLIQHVVGSKMMLEAQLDDLPADHQVHEVVHHLGKGIADGRRVIRGVRPSVLDEPGLSGLLHELVEHFSTVGLKVEVAACPDSNDSDVPDAIRTAVFRICQEALTNSWKHSGCNKATVRIEKHGDCLNVEIDDDGHGIDPYRHAANTGFGLEGMDARARLLGGSLEIVGKDKGTRVRAQLPLYLLQTA